MPPLCAVSCAPARGPVQVRCRVQRARHTWPEQGADVGLQSYTVVWGWREELPVEHAEAGLGGVRCTQREGKAGGHAKP